MARKPTSSAGDAAVRRRRATQQPVAQLVPGPVEGPPVPLVVPVAASPAAPLVPPGPVAPDPVLSVMTPVAAPLAPPPVPAPVAPVSEEKPGPVSQSGVAIAAATRDADSLIVDAATKEPPVDLGSVFEPVTPYGSAQRCRIRLHQIVFRGRHRHRTEHLLISAGQVVTAERAAVLLSVLRGQLETAGDPRG